MNYSLRRLPTALLLALLLTFAGCSKDAILETQPEAPQTESLFANRIVDVTENYDYYGEKFSVTYTLDQESEKVIAVSGDVDRARELFTSKAGMPEGSIITVGNMEVDASTHIQLFDTREEADAITQANEKSWCEYLENAGGTSVFRYYEHANYVGELQDLTKPNRWRVYWNSVMSHNNDKISSIAADGNRVAAGNSSSHIISRRPRVVLYEDICYGGNYVTLYADVTGHDWAPNIGAPGQHVTHIHYTLRIPNLVAVSLYLGYWQGWTNWNDRTSSLRQTWSNLQ